MFFVIFTITLIATVYSRTLKKRDLQEVEDNEALYTSHGNYGGGGGGGGHGHATSYQSYVLHAFHPSKFHVKDQ